MKNTQIGRRYLRGYPVLGKHPGSCRCETCMDKKREMYFLMLQLLPDKHVDWNEDLRVMQEARFKQAIRGKFYG